MTSNVTNELLLEHLKRLQLDVSTVKSDVSQIKAELVAVKTHIGALVRRLQLSEDA